LGDAVIDDALADKVDDPRLSAGVSRDAGAAGEGDPRRDR
jgi:hypothetical protein